MTLKQDLPIAAASSIFSAEAFWYKTNSRQAPKTLLHTTYLQHKSGYAEFNTGTSF